MKKLTVLVFVICLSAPVFGQEVFNIVDPNGPPLQTGDTVAVTNSNAFPGYAYSDAWYHFYHLGSLLAEVHIPFTHQHFYMDPMTYQIMGYADLYVGPYTYADEVRLEIALALGQQYHFFSRNSLVVEPTTLVTPSLNMWGLILLLILLPAYMVFRR